MIKIMANYVLSARTEQAKHGVVLMQNIRLLTPQDLTPQGILINLPNSDVLIIDREFIEIYNNLFKMLDETKL